MLGQKHLMKGSEWDMAIRFIGDFMFPYLSYEGYERIENDMENKTMELMQKHYEFYGMIMEEDSYVTKGAILCCSAGSELSVFDLLVDHAVERSDGAAVGICTDCRENENIISFGYCSKPTPDGYPKRSATASFAAPGGMVEKEKCIPMLDTGWQTGRREALKIYEPTQNKYCDVLTTRAYLTCFYGGLIKVAEVYTEYDKIQAIDRIDVIRGCRDEQINTIKYVIKALLMDGYSPNFVCGVAGNIIAEGGQAGHFEGANYGDVNQHNNKPPYLLHMVRFHQYRPDDWEAGEILGGAEKVSDQNIYDLESGTGIFSKQLGWDSENRKFICDACDACGDGSGDHICADHKFGFGMCQWTENGINSNGEVVGPERLQLLITKYLDEFGENAKPNWRECCRVETDYLCQELQSTQYSEIASIDQGECSLERATEVFLRKFEMCKDMDKELPKRLEYAQNVLEAIMGVWDEES